MKRFNSLAVALLIAMGTAAAHAQTLGFIDDQAVRNDLQGTLPGMVKFAQSHTVDPNGNAARELPTLVTEREAMVMFLPEATIPTADWSQLRLDVFVKGKLQGELVLAPPEVFPLSDRPVRDARPDVLYSTKAWTTRIPWQWMRPGLSLRFRYQGKVGDLAETHVEFAAPSELVLQNIRIGMLAPPPASSTNRMETNLAEAAIDYFQKVPVSRVTIGQYLPVTLDRIVMPNGNIYTTASPDNGEPHFGDMREDIGKALISIGINNANFGIVDSAGRSQQYHDHFRQITMHQSVGRYANGVIQHGLSGGGGMATLYELRGNEFSHELGHNFGLGHWPGGGVWSSHHATSGWGYDAFRDRMLANLAWTPKASDNVIEGHTTPAYKGLYAFGKDPMASGEPDSAISQYTLHTGYTAKRVQENLAGSPVIHPASVSGHMRWDPATKTMLADRSKKKPTQFGVPVTTLVGFYDPQGVLPSTIYPAMYGNHGHAYALPVGTTTGCRLDVTYATQAATSIRLASTRHASNEMNKFHVNVPTSSQPKTAAVSCVVDGAMKELHRITIAAPSATLLPPLKVGREEGFLHAALRLPGISAIAGRKPVSSHAELEAKLEGLYGTIQDVSSSAVGRPGTTYRFDNPTSGRREYFTLKVARYGAFPTNGVSNAHWRYIGQADAHVNWTPEPFRAMRTKGASTTEKMLAYYGAKQLKQWRSPDATARVGDIFVYNNPVSKKLEYFRLNRPTYWYFPTNGRSADAWTYLGDHASMTIAFSKRTQEQASAAIARWYRQASVYEWSDTAQGNVGDVYRLAHSGRVDYFALRTPQYWYFPSDKTSNQYWTYLGSAY